MNTENQDPGGLSLPAVERQGFPPVSVKLKQLSNELFNQYYKTPTVEIRNKLVTLHVRLVYAVARKYQSGFVCFEDLTQIGTLGLIKAIEKFDPTVSNAFVKYAKQFIKGEIAHYFRDHANPIKPPRELHELYFKGLKVVLGDSDNPDLKISDELGISVTKWLSCKNACKKLVSLDKAVYEGHKHTMFIVDTLSDPTSQNMWSSLELNLSLDRLCDRHRSILDLYYLKDLTKKETAKRLNISRSTLERHLNKAMSQLKGELCQG